MLILYLPWCVANSHIKHLALSHAEHVIVFTFIVYISIQILHFHVILKVIIYSSSNSLCIVLYWLHSIFPSFSGLDFSKNTFNHQEQSVASTSITTFPVLSLARKFFSRSNKWWNLFLASVAGASVLSVYGRCVSCHSHAFFDRPNFASNWLPLHRIHGELP